MNVIWSYRDTFRSLLFRDEWQNAGRVDYPLVCHCLIICSVLLLTTSCASLDRTEAPEPAPVDSALTAASNAPPIEQSVGSTPATKDAEASTNDSTVLADSSPPDEPNGLSEEIRQRLVDAIAKDLSQPMKMLTIEAATPQTWPNGCLGLGTPDELCTMALVEGWQVTIKSSDTVTTYRSNANGTVVRREN